MMKIETEKYAQLISIMYATEHLIKYINNDVIKYNDLGALDLKYLNQRTDRLTELITKIDSDEK